MGHHHEHESSPARYNQAFLIGMVLNTGFVLVEASYGYLAHSLALIADAGHNLSDVLGLGLAWGAGVLARRAPSGRYTYGLGRSTMLAALVNALILLVVTGGIIWESIRRFLEPGAVAEATVIAVALIGIAINAGCAWLFATGHKEDLNIRGAFLHLASDALVSLGVVLTGFAILWTGWVWLDPMVSLILAGVVVAGTWHLLHGALKLVLDGVPPGVDLPTVRAYLDQLPGVQEVHDLHIWGMSTTETALTAHLVMPGGCPGDRFLHEVCQQLHDAHGIEHATLQVEVGDSVPACSLGSRSHS
ncbi:cation diffusion facilitator family transporter [Anthocerotibacter panamensis]|uniref:cation diffusion facilitator family transporter n=1 Tax=Anthocerotibacter panamensis TaxID=2857077 RepID=UPI001C406F28|nr:cation diffusion facilitator family transporter [Anthocerotibacter panamensis]